MKEFSNNKYNLEERTAKFGEDVIMFYKDIKQDAVSKPKVQERILGIRFLFAKKKRKKPSIGLEC